MNLADVMDELGNVLDQIEGLRVFPYFADKLVPPAAMVAWPDEFQFDQTFARGSDRVVFPVVIAVGRADARSSRDRLAQYVAGTGPASVKAVVEAHTPIGYDSCRVQSVEFGTLTSAGTSYLAATFEIEVFAPGEVT